MAKINLLPWRETQRKEKQQEFLVMLAGGAAIALLAVILVHFQVHNMIKGQERRNNYLTNEIKILDDRIKEIKKLDATRRALIERMEVIQNLQATRPGIVHLFDEIENTLPQGLHLTSVSQSGSQIQISGRAESNARVSTYMRNIEKSDWMAKPKLNVISSKDKDGQRISEFSLRANQTTPSADEKG